MYTLYVWVGPAGIEPTTFGITNATNWSPVDMTNAVVPQESTSLIAGTEGLMSHVTSSHRTCSSSASRAGAPGSSSGTAPSAWVTFWTGDIWAGWELSPLSREECQPFYYNYHLISLLSQYYISARHMALAKAFPDTYFYQPHDSETVSLSCLSCLWGEDMLFPPFG